MKYALVVFAAMLWCVDTRAGVSSDDPQTIIARYVESSRHWRPDEYRVQQQHRDGNQDVYTVVYIPETLRPMAPGGGKSFVLLYDPNTRRVTRELAFQ